MLDCMIEAHLFYLAYIAILAEDLVQTDVEVFQRFHFRIPLLDSESRQAIVVLLPIKVIIEAEVFIASCFEYPGELSCSFI